MATQESYNIVVLMRLEPGRYKKAFAKSLIPDKNGNIRVRYASGKFSSWSIDNTLTENYIAL
jgi:hypothetical protein